MPITANQLTLFFEADAQMALPHSTRLQLAQEGITTVRDLVDFDKDTIEQVSNNLRRPTGRITDPNYVAPNPLPVPPPQAPTIPQPPFVFGAKSQKRLLVACDLIRFYETIGRPLTAPNVMWDPTMRNFGEQWKALKGRKAEELPDTPQISKALPIIKWVETFKDHLQRCIGVRMIPLVYVVRIEVDVPAVCSPLAESHPYSLEHGSMEVDMIARASHGHGLFREDCAEVYYKLEEATRGTPYADSIKPFQRQKNGRDAFLALTGQYAGQDKWETEIKKMDNLLHTRRWKGQSNFPLEKFIQQHRNAFVSMRACQEHVEYQLPTEHTRVTYLLDAIESSHPPLLAAMANIEDDSDTNGKRNNFELAVAYLIPKDPVVKRRTAEGTKRTQAEISNVTNTSSGGTPKTGIGKTGVHLRWYNRKEYQTLNADQKTELYEFRKNEVAKNPKGNGAREGTNNNNSNNPSGRAAKRQKAIAAAVEKEVVSRLEGNSKQTEIDKATDEDVRNYIISLMSTKNTTQGQASVQSTSATQISSENQAKARVTLQSILKRAK